MKLGIIENVNILVWNNYNKTKFVFNKKNICVLKFILHYLICRIR